MQPEHPADESGRSPDDTPKVNRPDSPDEEEAVRHSPPGTAAGHNTTRADTTDSEPGEAQRATGERARRDAESEQQNTDCYDTSGQAEPPPKTPYSR